MEKKEINIRGIECDSAGDAFGWIDARGGGRTISIATRLFVVDRDEADRIEATGVPFAYLFDHPMPDGTYRTLSVPVNDD